MLGFFLFIISVAHGADLPTIDQIRGTHEAPFKIQATGQRESLEPVLNGQNHGTARYYHANGQLYGLIHWDHGQKVGSHTLYRENGIPEQYLSYKEGKLSGTCLWTNDDGLVSQYAQYIDGELETSNRCQRKVSLVDIVNHPASELSIVKRCAADPCAKRRKNSPKSIAEALNRSRVVVSGKISSGGFVPDPISQSSQSMTTVQIARIWKGPIEESLQFALEYDQCIDFKKDTEYLFFFSNGRRLFPDLTQPIETAGGLIAELGDGWVASSYPMTDKRLSCAPESKIERRLNADRSRVYSCPSAHNIHLKQVLVVHDNGNVKETGQEGFQGRKIGEWISYNPDGSNLSSRQYDADGQEICPAPEIMNSNEVVFAYTKNRTLYPLAIWNQSKLKPAQNIGIGTEPTLLAIGQETGHSFKINKPHRDSHTEACLYTATDLSGKIPDFTLFTSTKINFIIPIPNEAQKNFRDIFPNCQVQGDPGPEDPQPCVYPELIAVSDLNRNGRYELWYKARYRWDDGFSVAELSEDSKHLKPLASDCSDCSD